MKREGEKVELNALRYWRADRMAHCLPSPGCLSDSVFMASHPGTHVCAGVVSPLLQQTRTTLNIVFSFQCFKHKDLFSKRQNYSGNEQVSGCQGLQAGRGCNY